MSIHKDQLLNFLQENKPSGSTEITETNEDDTKGLKTSIEAKRKNLITVKDHNDKHVKIITHTLYKEKVESLTLIMHVRNSEYYFFLFVLKNIGDQ